MPQLTPPHHATDKSANSSAPRRRSCRKRCTPAATAKRNINVMQHIVGFFKKRVTPNSRRDLQIQIEDYRAGLVPLVAAIFPIPKIALLPLFVIWFGIDEGSKYALIAISWIRRGSSTTRTRNARFSTTSAAAARMCT